MTKLKLRALAKAQNDENMEHVWEENKRLSVFGYDGFLFLVVTPGEFEQIENGLRYWYDINEKPVSLESNKFFIFGVDDYEPALEELERVGDRHMCHWCNNEVSNFEIVYPNDGSPLVLCNSCKKTNTELLDRVINVFNGGVDYDKTFKIVNRFASSKHHWRRALCGAYHHPDGRLVATNAEMLFVVHDGHDKTQAGKIVTKSGEVIKESYPDLDKMLEKYEDGHAMRVEHLSVQKMCALHRQMKTECKQALGSYRVYSPFTVVKDGSQLSLKIEHQKLDSRTWYLCELLESSDENMTPVVSYNVNYMMKVLNALRELGDKEFTMTIYLDQHVEPVIKLTTFRTTALVCGIRLFRA